MTPKEFVRDTAIVLNNNGQQMDGQQLANALNANGLQTTYYTPYSGTRGTYKLIHATYDWLMAQGLNGLANMVATRFVNSQGDHAWDK